ncbi:ABC transporter ATP-binding protein [Oharaeibacter diazotrophicus]|uniref:Putative spermidine/putrescine transport system ATP-binding protein/spermidine/putrescine transport system ATP-binding protein n=3 Tax=Oharaeibacter diazotrophicus TaxID=1920512 RepID=A0A4R6RK76_9HYPH|nr:ABC transporter ATP-binding protein [Oharaeibacter diazotrophicus]TDP86327.1 putative spermidine/putrescine transport system ATP-binding protein/spermidine/putrescine transport system ATP-binding protein [Oharaeibacter diazotrophicus]BBE71730.1 maltose/maltodextrin import ATP-binding protein MalK [Pleomorphomonas sp. SM30]GLS78496.1 Fe3+/spermidine/putrescine ABC transporter ATP-binding protein [Oharaeibacter diazotrophicus]
MATGDNDAAGGGTAIIDATGIVKDYGHARALHGVSLTVAAGEFVALVGPSGCGKTTLLKILAGFEEATAGRLTIQGRDMHGVPAAARPTRMVFQKLALFPHKTVGDNIGFPLKLQKVAKADATARVAAMADLMHLKPEYLGRWPAQLSGGEQQRVALARALVSQPSVLLLDEPMSALDAKLKKSLQAELKKLHRELGTSFVLVTHDLEEAMMLADRICVMRAGRVVQIGTPADIYYRPVDTFVAGFIGETNFLPVTATAAAGGGFSVTSPLARGGAATIAAERAAPGAGAGRAALLVRPETIGFVTGEPAPGRWVLDGEVEEYFVKGASTQYRVRVAGLQAALVMDLPGSLELPAEVGAKVAVGFDPAGAYLLPEAP